MLNFNSNVCIFSGPSGSKWYHWHPRVRRTGEGEYLPHLNCVIFLFLKGETGAKGIRGSRGRRVRGMPGLKVLYIVHMGI